MSRPQKSQGFTLIEVVVALSLLGLLMLATSTAFRGFAQTATRLDDMVLAGDEMRIVSATMRHLIGEARAPAGGASESDDGGDRLTGGPDTLRWVATMPARDGIGGLSVLRLSLSDAGDGHARLMLAFKPFASGIRDDQAAGGIERALLEDITGFRIDYLGSGETAWVSHWRHQDALPAKIRIHISRKQQQWPPLIIHLLHASPPDGFLSTRWPHEAFA